MLYAKKVHCSSVTKSNALFGMYLETLIRIFVAHQATHNHDLTAVVAVLKSVDL